MISGRSSNSPCYCAFVTLVCVRIAGAPNFSTMGDFVDEITGSNGAYKYYVNGEWKESTR